MLVGLIIIIVLVVIVGIWFMGKYNGLIAKRNTVVENFGQIDTQLQRRFDLIPNLVQTVKQYAKHEESVFTAVTEARADAQKALASQDVAGAAKADELLRGAAMRINAVAEAYPDLKASTNFSQLQEELTSTENKVSFARQAYNDAVNTYNTGCEQFPGNIVAGMFNFKKKDMFEVEAPEARKAVQVDFS